LPQNPIDIIMDNMRETILKTKTIQNELFNGKHPDRIRSIINKSICISSGKGGVGKTTTAANLAIYYSKTGKSVGLLDLDPLSDISTILDIKESEAIQNQGFSPESKFEDNRVRVFENLDLIFPCSKFNPNDSTLLLKKIYTEFSREIDRYEVLIFDMPAGNSFDNNLLFLPFMKLLLLVTNPEPTAHVSAGGYIKSALNLEPDKIIYLWHNKFSGFINPAFNPKDVVYNYNKNVPEEIRLTHKNVENIKNHAFIPKDPSLDMLHGYPSPVENILSNIIDLMEAMQESRLKKIFTENNRKIYPLIEYYISRNKNITPVDEYINNLGNYLNTFLKKNTELNTENKNFQAFTKDEFREISDLLKELSEDNIRQSIIKVISILKREMENISSSTRMFSSRKANPGFKTIDREITKLLILLSKNASCFSQTTKNNAGLLLFFFSLLKLFQSETVTKLVLSFIPVKKDRKGETIRDRNAQIQNLIINNDYNKKRFFLLIKKLYPVINKQITTIVKTFGLQPLLIRDKKKKVFNKAYLKFFTKFVHEMIYSRLGIIIGFEYRSAAIAFRKGAEKLLKLL